LALKMGNLMMNGAKTKHITRTNTKALSALGRVLRPRPCYWRYEYGLNQ
jgi:hypothetical protein